MAPKSNVTVLVTGHDGYIGTVLVETLRRSGYTVKGFDTAYFHGGALTPCARPHEITTKDIRSASPEDFDGVGAIVHLAGLSNDALGELDPRLTIEINAQASLRLATLAKQAEVPRFICASSCSMYGVNNGVPASEVSPLRPITTYATSKVLMEHSISALCDETFAPTFLRNGTAYGFSPKMRFDLVLNNLIGSAMATGQIVLLSDGTPWRPMVHVDDIARSIIAVLEAPQGLISNQAINVGDDNGNHRIIEIADVVRRTIPGTRIVVRGTGDKDDRSYRVDFSRLRELLPDFRSKWTIESGAAALYEMLQAVDFVPRDFMHPRFVRIEWLRHLISTGEVNSDLRWATAHLSPHTGNND